MSIFKRLIYSFLLKFKQLAQLNYRPARTTKIFHHVPYYSQTQTGAKNQEDHELWRNNACGLACLQMILDNYKLEVPKIVELGQQSLNYGCFKLNSKAIGGMDGLFYKPFIEFVKKEFGLDAKIISPMTIKDIIKNISHDNFVIASVSSEIRDLNSKPKHKGGHLVLIIGYDCPNKQLTFHNTGFDNSQVYQKINIIQFGQFFDHKGITIKFIPP